MSIRFKLVTPDRILFEEEVDSVSIPTANGEVTILPHHVTLSSIVVAGVIRLHRSSGDEDVAVSSGFLNVIQNGQVVVLTDTAERAHELDISVIKEAEERARQVMRQAVIQDDVSFAAAAAALERELARTRVAQKRVSKQHGSVPSQQNIP